MPPKKKGRKVKLPKIAQQQINNITKRLMDITLKVDHYIYKNRPISSAAATSYLQEVTTYQARCKRDARSLQVIEKLSRFMQAIIEEQSRNCDAINYDDGFNTRHAENVRASPVYSLTEEDKSEMQITVTNSRENTSLDICKEKNQLRTNSPTFKNKALSTLTIVHFEKSNNQINDTGIIDLCSYDGQTDIENKNNSDKETHMNNEIVVNENAYIRLDDESPLCSQSILNTWVVPEVDNDNIQSLPAEQCGQDMVEVDKAITNLINRTPTEPRIKENNASCNENFKNKMKAKFNKVEDISKITKAPPDVLGNQVKIPVKKTRKRTPKNAKINKRGNNKTKYKPNNTAKTKQIETLKYTSAENRLLSKNTKNTKSNNFEETDLSWIENIKYVRQINKDEYDPSLTTLCESFWENCDLPPGWDDRDFNY